MRLWDAAGYLASGLVVMVFCMKDIIQLRVVALTSNIAFSFMELHSVSLPSGCCTRSCSRLMMAPLASHGVPVRVNTVLRVRGAG